eukprot:6084828-Pleurochrysis_carterae.AAC.1
MPAESTVMKRALKPSSSASLTVLAVAARNCVWAIVRTAAISRSGRVAMCGAICTTPAVCAARASATSPSGWARPPFAAPEMYTCRGGNRVQAGARQWQWIRIRVADASQTRESSELEKKLVSESRRGTGRGARHAGETTAAASVRWIQLW